MKMFKRAFVGVLVLALLVSCVAFVALATDKEYTVDNYDDILEYYEEPVIFDYDFEDMAVGESFTGPELQKQIETQQTATICGDDNEKYLELKNSPFAKMIRALYLNWNSPDEEGKETSIDDFLFTAVVSGNSMVKVYVDSSEKTTANTTSERALFSLYFGTETDAEKNVVKYYNGTSLVALTDAEGNDFKLIPGEKYEVKLAYVSSENGYSLEVTKTSDETVTAKVENVATPVTSVVNVRFGADLTSAKVGAPDSGAANVVTNVHSISAYGGAFFRDPGDRQAETEAAVLKMNELFFDDGVALDAKLGIATVVGRLVSIHGFTSEDADVAAAVDAVVKGSIALYAEQLDACVEGVTDSLTYDQRVDNVKAYEDFLMLIPGNYAEQLGQDQQELIDKIAASIKAFEDERDLLEVYKENSDAFIAALDGADATSVDYAVLAPYYDDATPYYENIYANYQGISDAIAAYEKIAEKMEVFRGAVDAFVTNAIIVGDTESSFGDRYTAYVVAKANELTEETFAGVSTYVNADGNTYADALDALASAYADVEVTLSVDGEDVTYTGIEALIALCEEYIANVNSANTALYMKAQVGFLDAADANLKQLNEKITDPESYPGFTDAQDMYRELDTEISANIAAAEAYYAAVMELKTIQESDTPLEGDALLEKIDEIEVLRQTGDILGVEYVNDQGETVKVDVASANIYLSDLTSELSLELGYNEQYISRVESIDFDNMTTAELYAAISLAKSAEANEYVTDEYAEVAEAMADLAAAIARYNEMIALSNSAFADVNGVGAEISSLPANESSDEVTELIKNLFD